MEVTFVHAWTYLPNCSSDRTCCNFKVNPLCTKHGPWRTALVVCFSQTIAYLLTNSSKPFFRSSMKSSSNRPVGEERDNSIICYLRIRAAILFLMFSETLLHLPSSPLKGSWRFRAFPGSGGTTIYKAIELCYSHASLSTVRNTFGSETTG